jgi:hypothetical protein
VNSAGGAIPFKTGGCALRDPCRRTEHEKIAMYTIRLCRDDERPVILDIITPPPQPIEA